MCGHWRLVSLFLPSSCADVSLDQPGQIKTGSVPRRPPLLLLQTAESHCPRLLSLCDRSLEDLLQLVSTSAEKAGREKRRRSPLILSPDKTTLTNSRLVVVVVVVLIQQQQQQQQQQQLIAPKSSLTLHLTSLSFSFLLQHSSGTPS